MGASALNELGGSDVTDLDLLVLAMLAAACVHARSESALRGESLRGGYVLLLGSALVGLITEFGSIRFGGTHCHHASAYANFATCSSANSVLYYAPWIYCCVATAVRLTGSDRDGRADWALPWLCGALTFGVCGVYEMQGPLMQWWEWPGYDTRLAADPAHPRGHIWRPFFRFAHTGYEQNQLGADGPLLMSPHAAEALQERLWGFPVMAPFFDMFFGWGIGAALWLAHDRCGTLLCVIFGPFLALFWDLPVRALTALDVPRAISVPLIMGVAIIVPLLLLPGGLARRSASEQPDWALFAIPLLNQLFFVRHALTCGYGEHSPVGLKMVVVGVATCSLLAHAIGAGLICKDDSASAPTAPPKRQKGRRGSSRSASPAAPSYSRSSFLDRLQKDAQASELDHTNTSPLTFLCLTLIQLPVCHHLATWMGLPTYTAWIPILSHILGFVWGHYVLHSDKWFDVWGECTLFVTFVYSHYDISRRQEPSTRQCLATALALLWTTRLGIFLGWRIIQRGSDWRFTKLIEGGPAYNVFGWVSQGTWIFLQGMAIWVVHHGPDGTSNSPVSSSSVFSRCVTHTCVQDTTDLLGCICLPHQAGYGVTVVFACHGFTERCTRCLEFPPIRLTTSTC
eukprot:COSAG03_NODE_36_length_17658_cov_56.766900_10_plen_626_part_00